MIKSLYIHIPFCQKICTYCDFAKLVANDKLMEDYLSALIKELDYYKNQLTSIKTIHIGGGTPSSLPIHLLERIFIKLSQIVDLSRLEEFGFETNPNDVSESLVTVLKKYHVNRVSLGVESSFNHHLVAMNRSHNIIQVIEAVNILQMKGIKNYNLDFIYAWPNQTFDELIKDIDFAVKLNPTHLSFYGLILEPKTKLNFDYEHRKIQLIDEDTDASMYEYLMKELPKLGFEQYEISNYAKPGFESKHNLTYWQIEEYLGIGMGAHSQVNAKRFHNFSSIKDYISSVNTEGYGFQSEDACDLMQETFIMGLRLNVGVNVNHFKQRFSLDPLILYPDIQKNINELLLVYENDVIKLTDRGRLLLNYVEQSFI